jgi:hypothetical protein
VRVDPIQIKSYACEHVHIPHPAPLPPYTS